MLGVYQALPSEGLSLPEFRHRQLPSVPLSESRFEELGSEHRDRDKGDENLGQGDDFGDGNPCSLPNSSNRLSDGGTEGSRRGVETLGGIVLPKAMPGTLPAFLEFLVDLPVILVVIIIKMSEVSRV